MFLNHPYYFEVAVQINGVDVKEYDAPDADDDNQDIPTFTKYIECIDDALFTIRHRVQNGYKFTTEHKTHALEFKTLVDGRKIKSTVVSEPRENIVHGRNIIDDDGNNAIQQLQFASIKTVDDAKKERVKSDLKHAQDLGLIEVRVKRGISHGNSYHGPPAPHKADEKLEFAEKSLKGKAISHAATSRSTMPSTMPRYVDWKPLDDDRDLVKFRFLYRSRDALKREMVIPRSPTPPSSTFTALSDAELRRLARERFEQLQDTPVKNERRRPIKREFGEVQDLTGDEVPKKQRKGKMTRVDGKKVMLIELSDDEED